MDDNTMLELIDSTEGGGGGEGAGVKGRPARQVETGFKNTALHDTPAGAGVAAGVAAGAGDAAAGAGSGSGGGGDGECISKDPEEDGMVE